MADPEQEEQPEIKVTDRRLFTPDGELRPGVTIETPKAEPPASKQPSADPKKAPEPPKAAPPEPPPEAQGTVQFEHLVMSLLTTAMMQMGLAARPGEVQPPPDLAAAQETLELLQVLQQKTKGNLTPQEEEVLSGGLYELRMAFVELARRAKRGR